MAGNVADMSFEDVMDSFLKDIEDISTGLSDDEKAEITQTGAKVLQTKLSTATKTAPHFRAGVNEDEHLADSVMVQDTNIDGKKDGTSIVGFDPRHAHIARFLNDGTKISTRRSKKMTYKNPGKVAITGDSFIDTARAEAANDVLNANAQAYAKLVEKKGGD